MKVLLIHNKTGLLPFLIRKFTRSFYNHLAIEVFIEDAFYIIESTAKGVICTNKDIWLKRSTREYREYDISDANKNNLLRLLGLKYQFNVYFDFVFNRKQKVDNRYYCMELMKVALDINTDEIIDGNFVLEYFGTQYSDVKKTTKLNNGKF